jgi:preprotein translocase SecF subunit
MFNIVQKRRWFFLFSGIVISISFLLMIYSTITTGAPFQMSIDFEGGSIYEVSFTEDGVTEAALRQVFAEFGDDNVIIQQLGDVDARRWSIRGTFRDPETTQALVDSLDGNLAPLDRDFLRIEQVSATIGQEVTRAAFMAIFVAALVILGFIVFAFRQVPKAFRYGMCAVTAMVHDVLVVLGVMSLFGLLFGWEVDALFLTAVLTVVGFSVQDSVVIFDRIRENIPKYLGEPYEAITNRSIWETIHRTQATQLNAFFIMIAILLFGGETVKQFVTILMIGLISGSYSSIFTAVPMLVAWERGEIPFIKGDDVLTQSPAEA